MAKNNDEHSIHYEKVLHYYQSGIWNKKKVYNAVGKWITESEYTEITNEPYEE